MEFKIQTNIEVGGVEIPVVALVEVYPAQMSEPENGLEYEPARAEAGYFEDVFGVQRHVSGYFTTFDIEKVEGAAIDFYTRIAA